MFKKLINLFSNPTPSEPEVYWVRGVRYETKAGYEAALRKTDSPPPAPRKAKSATKPKPRAFPTKISSLPVLPKDDVEKWVGWNICGYTRVVGVTAYRENSEHTAMYSGVDNQLDLVREPDNPHDKNAIMVLDSHNQLGYIDRHLAKALNKKYSTEMPIRALFKNGYVGETGAISIDILPQMPCAKERKANRWQE